MCVIHELVKHNAANLLSRIKGQGHTTRVWKWNCNPNSVFSFPTIVCKYTVLGDYLYLDLWRIHLLYNRHECIYVAQSIS